MPNLDPSIAQELLAHQAFLRRLASDLVGEDADDLVQDVWRRALERPPHHARQLRGWLARVARNLAANRWRGEARRTERETRRALEEPASMELEERLEMRKELVAALDALSPSSRETLLLRYFEGLAPLDIARRQGTPVATVKTRLRRGLGQLREALDVRHGGDRRTWMSAVTALGAPVGSGAGATKLVVGGVIVGTTTKVAAAILVVAGCLYFSTRALEEDSPQPSPTRVTAVESPASGVDTKLASEKEPVAEAVRRVPVPQQPLDAGTAGAVRRVLRVVLEGLAAEDARLATVTLATVDGQGDRPAEIDGPWPCQGRTSEFELEPFLVGAAQQEGSRLDAIQVEVDHPHRLRASARIDLSRGLKRESGRVVHELRLRLPRPEYWPEFRLTVRDAETRVHLQDVELRSQPGAGMAMWGRNPKTARLGDGLSSPVALLGARDPDDPAVRVAGLALLPETDEAPRPVELASGMGVILSARAPGYAWGSIAIDVSRKAEHELLLHRGSALDLQVTNVQLERYAALETEPTLCVYWIRADGGNQYVRFAPLDEALVKEGLRVESLSPGGYRVTVELGGGSWTKQPVLALEEVALAAGESRELVLALTDPPAAPERATLAGVLSLPTFGGEESVRLQLYFQPTQRWRSPDVEFSLAELQRVPGALPSWSFRAEDLPVGRYRVQLLPFLKVWMIDLPAAGLEDLELVLPELAEVNVETVDGRSGERVLLDEFHYRKEAVPGQVSIDRAQAETVEPGRFRFWTAPGAVTAWPRGQGRLGYGSAGKELELAPGAQSLRFELEPACLLRFEFRIDGAAPRLSDGVDDWVRYATYEAIRPVDHEGRSMGRVTTGIAEVSAPGLYEVDFEGFTADRLHPIPPRRVDVRAGELTEVLVELRRK